MINRIVQIREFPARVKALLCRVFTPDFLGQIFLSSLEFFLVVHTNTYHCGWTTVRNLERGNWERERARSRGAKSLNRRGEFIFQNSRRRSCCSTRTRTARSRWRSSAWWWDLWGRGRPVSEYVGESLWKNECIRGGIGRVSSTCMKTRPWSGRKPRNWRKPCPLAAKRYNGNLNRRPNTVLSNNY